VEFNIKHQGEETIILLEGRLGFGEAEEVVPAIEEIMDERRNRLVFDLSKLSMITSDGLAGLLHLRYVAKKKGGYVRIVNPQHMVREVFETTRLSGLFQLPED